MSAVQIHLVAVHLPVFASLAGALLFLAARIGRSETLFKTSCCFLLAAALGAAAAYFSGPPAYETLQAWEANLDRGQVESHAALGKGAFFGMVLLGLAAGLALAAYAQGESPAPWLRWVLLVGAFALAYLLAWTAHLGGLVRHGEARLPAWPFFPLI